MTLGDATLSARMSLGVPVIAITILLLPTALTVRYQQHESINGSPGVDPPGRLYDRMAGERTRAIGPPCAWTAWCHHNTNIGQLLLNKVYVPATDLIKPYGYTLEEHFVETVDGYILRMFRIPHGSIQPQQQQQQHLGTLHRLLPWLTQTLQGILNNLGLPAAARGLPQQSDQRPVVHMQHGLLGSSTDWLLNGPGLSLPLLLADAGAPMHAGRGWLQYLVVNG